MTDPLVQVKLDDSEFVPIGTVRILVGDEPDPDADEEPEQVFLRVDEKGLVTELRQGGYVGGIMEYTWTDILAQLRQASSTAPPETWKNDPAEIWYDITYHCPDCGHIWQESWTCACDSECPQCGARDIQANSYTEME